MTAGWRPTAFEGRDKPPNCTVVWPYAVTDPLNGSWPSSAPASDGAGSSKGSILQCGAIQRVSVPPSIKLEEIRQKNGIKSSFCAAFANSVSIGHLTVGGRGTSILHECFWIAFKVVGSEIQFAQVMGAEPKAEPMI
jgi:hypothetical protein